MFVFLRFKIKMYFFKLTTQFALWDLLKTSNTLKEHKKINLAYITADLLRHQSISLSTMKVF